MYVVIEREIGRKEKSVGFLKPLGLMKVKCGSFDFDNIVEYASHVINIRVARPKNLYLM
jgi:hypothetical protein